MSRVIFDTSSGHYKLEYDLEQPHASDIAGHANRQG